jgi:hypothetical protein
MKKLLLGVSLIAAVLVCAVLLGGAGDYGRKAEAQAAAPVYGWMWSDNVGWISFNCFDVHGAGCGSPGKVNYSVQKDAANNLSGYAWSDNVGWISFNPTDVSVCGTQASLINGLMNGWARAVVASPATGWDGCLSFRGSVAGGGTYGAQAAASAPSSWTPGIRGTGFSWGSDVVGWVDSFVSAAVPNECTGTKPSGNGIITGSNTGSANSWAYTVNTTPLACEWTCASGYTRSGNACVPTSLSCIGPDGATILAGQGRTYYENNSPVCTSACQSEVRVCNGATGTLSGSYTYPSCTVQACVPNTCSGTAPLVDARSGVRGPSTYDPATYAGPRSWQDSQSYITSGTPNACQWKCNTPRYIKVGNSCRPNPIFREN